MNEGRKLGYPYFNFQHHSSDKMDSSRGLPRKAW